MLVSQILKSKATQGIISVKPSDPVSTAVKLMSENRVGTMVVSADGESLDGIISERDVVREMGKHGTGCIDGPVSSMMTAKLVTIAPSETADHAMQLMTDGRFRHLPVMENGQMIGLISIGDVVKARLSELAMEKDALQGMIMGH